MADEIEIVLAADCITQIDVGAQQSLLAVDWPRQHVRKWRDDRAAAADKLDG